MEIVNKLKGQDVKTSAHRMPVKPVSHGKAVLILGLGTAFLAFTPIWVKASNMDPATQAFLRILIGVLCLAPIGFWEWKRKGALPKKGISIPSSLVCSWVWTSPLGTTQSSTLALVLQQFC